MFWWRHKYGHIELLVTAMTKMKMHEERRGGSDSGIQSARRNMSVHRASEEHHRDLQGTRRHRDASTVCMFMAVSMATKASYMIGLRCRYGVRAR